MQVPTRSSSSLKPLAAALLLAGVAGGASAQISGDVVKIGIITDMSSVYADIDGAGGVEAVKMAIADAKGMVAARRSNSSSPTTRTRRTWRPPRRGSGSTPRGWTC